MEKNEISIPSFCDDISPYFDVLSDEKPVSLMIERNGNSYVLCTLQHGKHFQQPLDLEFASGEELTFFIRGKGSDQVLLFVYSHSVMFLLCQFAESFAAKRHVQPFGRINSVDVSNKQLLLYCASACRNIQLT